MNNLKMQDLVSIKNDVIVADSRIIAQNFNKNHFHVLRDIENILDDLSELGQLNFEPSELGQSNFGLSDEFLLFEKTEYVNSQNKLQPMYNLNRQRFELLAMGFTGKKALEWKLKYIKAFNDMENALKNNTSLGNNKDMREKLLDAITKAPVKNVPYIVKLYPEYFTELTTTSTQNNKQQNKPQLNKNNSVSTIQKWINDNEINCGFLSEYPTVEVYEHYCEYCKEYGMNVVGRKTFFKYIEDEFQVTRKQRGDGCRHFIQI